MDKNINSLTNEEIEKLEKLISVMEAGNNLNTFKDVKAEIEKYKKNIDNKPIERSLFVKKKSR